MIKNHLKWDPISCPELNEIIFSNLFKKSEKVQIRAFPMIARIEHIKRTD